MKNKLKEKSYKVLQTSVFFCNASKLFKDDELYFGSKNEKKTDLNKFRKDWRNYFVEHDQIALMGRFWIGRIGIEGELSLFIPPAKKDVDILGYSRSEGECDWWGFLSCTTIPANNNLTFVYLSFDQETYFDRPHDIICHLEINTHEYIVEDAWAELWNLFKKELDAEAAPDAYQKIELNF